MDRTAFDAAKLRRRAERVLVDRDLPSKVQLDPIRLLHELQVHQVELELQNEELVASNRDLDTLRVKFQTLYEAAPVGYLTLSRNGKVVECNAQALQMLARNIDAVNQRPLRDCFEIVSHEVFDALIGGALESGSSDMSELMLHRPQNLPMYVRAQARALQLSPDDDVSLLFIMMDISSLKFAIDDMVRVIQKDAQ